MKFADFVKLTDEKQQTNPIWFGLDPDKAANTEEIELSQKELNLQLPDEYIQFIKQYGGGYFAFAIVYSLDKDSDFNIIKKNSTPLNPERCYLLFSENGSGDVYAFKTANNRCLPEIFFFDHETENWSETKYKNLFCFLNEIALSNN